MDDLLARVWRDLLDRIEGPMKFRILIQPLMACILAVRAGLRDARAGRQPFRSTLDNAKSYCGRPGGISPGLSFWPSLWT